MYGGRYFPDRFFAPTYFPNGATATVGYFPHGVFAQRFFANRYFPGVQPTGVITPPPAPVVVGGVAERHRRPRRIPAVVGELELVLQALQANGLGVATPVSVQGDIAAVLAALEATGTGRAVPVAVRLAIQSELQTLAAAGHGTITDRLPRRRDQSELDDLEDYYMHLLNARSRS